MIAILILAVGNVYAEESGVTFQTSEQGYTYEGTIDPSDLIDESKWKETKRVKKVGWKRTYVYNLDFEAEIRYAVYVCTIISKNSCNISSYAYLENDKVMFYSYDWDKRHYFLLQPPPEIEEIIRKHIESVSQAKYA